MTSAGAQTSGLTPEQIIGLNSVAEAALSPNGEQIAYRTDVWPEEKGPVRKAGRLWLISSGGGQPIRLAPQSFSADSPQWSPDGLQLAWIAKRSSDSPPQVFVSPAAGSGETQLTSTRGGVVAFRWSPDHKRIAFVAADAPGDETLTGKDWTIVGREYRQRRLYVVEAGTHKLTPVTNDGLTVHDFSWSPNSKMLALAAAPAPDEDSQLLRTQVYSVAATGTDIALLARTEGRLSHPVWSNDGKWIAWLGSTSITDPVDGSVFVVSASAPGEPRNLTEGLAGTASWLGAVPGAPATFAFVSQEWQATVLREVAIENAAIRTISATRHVFSGGPSFSADGRRFAIVANTPEHPDELFIANGTDSPELHRLTVSNSELAGIELGKQEVFRWRSKDGTPIEGVLLTPPQYRKGRRYPVILHIHGGSESVDSNGWQASFDNFGQSLAARGFVVLYPNYRGSRGRGVEFVRGNRKDMMGRSWEDIESGLDALIDAGIADGARAGIYGFSWGGYAAGWGATYASHRFKAAVAGAGIYNWISEAGSNSSRMHEQLAHWDAPLYENFGFYLARSPIFHIRHANTPILLLHGEMDQSCPVSQALEFHTALQWKGVPSELVIYPREEHGMSEYEHQLDFLTRGIAWFDRL